MMQRELADKVLIFDLGGVFIELRHEVMLSGFMNCFKKPTAEIQEYLQTNPVPFAYEKGLIDDHEFHQQTCDFFRQQVRFDIFREIWNSLLLPMPKRKIELLQQLKTTTQTLVLSNTNAMHKACFDQHIALSGKADKLSELVHTAYYSHLLKQRKPDEEVFETVLAYHQLVAANCVFFDDNADNIATAMRLGMHAVHIQSIDQILSYFP